MASNRRVNSMTAHPWSDLSPLTKHSYRRTFRLLLKLRQYHEVQKAICYSPIKLKGRLHTLMFT